MLGKVQARSPGGLVVFVSPQYARDSAIRGALRSYLSSVRSRLGWRTHIENLSPANNTVAAIDREIEALAKKMPLKAVLMVGEDIQTPLFAEDGNQETPMVAPWADTDGEVTAYTCESCTCCKDYKPEVAISLLYPNSLDSYSVKQAQLIATLNKFATVRPQSFGDNIRVLMAEEFTGGAGNKGFGFSAFTKLSRAGELTTLINPATADIDASLAQPWKLFSAEGHANHFLTNVNDDPFARPFFSTDLNRLNAPLYLSNGCFTAGWSVGQNASGNQRLDPPVGYDFWGHYVLTNPALLTELNSGQGPDFAYCAADFMRRGQTMAEAYVACDRNTEGVIMFGDPTLAFSPYTPASASDLEVWHEDFVAAASPQQGVAGSVNIIIRNTGDLPANAELVLYDVTNEASVVGNGSKVYPSKVDGRVDLEVCRRAPVVVAAGGTVTASCVITPKVFFNTFAIRVFDQSGNEDNVLDNGNVVYVIAQ